MSVTNALPALKLAAYVAAYIAAFTAACVGLVIGSHRTLNASVLFADSTAVRGETFAEVVTVTNAYALPALKGGTGGAFMTIANAGDVAVRITHTSSVDANAVELHESTEHSGMTHMQPLPALEIAPHASVALKPGGKHFMLINLRRAFAERDTMHLRLRVESVKRSSSDLAGTREIAIAVPVRIP